MTLMLVLFGLWFGLVWELSDQDVRDQSYYDWRAEAAKFIDLDGE